ncbi:MAG: type II toxin-antitoxin system VapC family toxin [Planctomycetes bacterium]|nr:type II toxin-antitoxin system VapC family toxin [Planctomycetota bacterium]
MWWTGEPGRLSPRVRELLDDDRTELVWSVVGTWELALKISRGKLKLPLPLPQFLDASVHHAGIQSLSIEARHALAQLELPGHHWDPFDRMLIAQAQVEGLGIVSMDRAFARYAVETIW